MKILFNKFYSDTGFERVGFVLNDNTIVEVPNICNEPEEGFQMRTDDILKYAERAKATWHTHPGVDANLSDEDYVTFKNWPNMVHYIVGKDGVREYQYDKKRRAILETNRYGVA